jgi:hypothetical protein
MRVQTLKVKNPGEIGEALNGIIPAGFSPTLAIVFVPGIYNLSEVAPHFTEKNIAVFGCSSYGNFIDRNCDTEFLAIMLLDISPEHFKIDIKENGSDSAKETAKFIAKKGKSFFSNPAFIIASGGVMTDGELLVDGILEEAGPDAQVFGALAANDLARMETFVFNNDLVTGNGILGLIIDADKIGIAGMAVGGWNPVGMYRTVTKSEGNVVYTIDDMPALDTVLRYSGASLEQLKTEQDLLRTASAFQIQVHRENASPIMRTPMHANFETKAIVFAGTIPQGAKVKFSLLPGFEVIDNVVKQYSEYKEEAKNAQAMILFSCQGRQIALGPWIGDEIERLQDIWNAPLIGLFSFGEIGPKKDTKSEFHNMTCSLVLLNEI